MISICIHLPIDMHLSFMGKQRNERFWMGPLMKPSAAFVLATFLALAADPATAIIPVATSHLSGESTFAASNQNVDVHGKEEGDEDHQKIWRSTPLGKRITSRLVAELGKRPRDLYSFGIGGGT